MITRDKMPLSLISPVCHNRPNCQTGRIWPIDQDCPIGQPSEITTCVENVKPANLTGISRVFRILRFSCIVKSDGTSIIGGIIVIIEIIGIVEIPKIVKIIRIAAYARCAGMIGIAIVAMVVSFVKEDVHVDIPM